MTNVIDQKIYLPETTEVLNVFRNLKPGDVVTYGQLLTATGRTDLREIMGAIQSAKNIVERDDKIVIKNIRKTGYKRLENNEIVDTAPVAVKTINRKAKKAARTLACTDFTSLSNDAKVTHNVNMSMLGAIGLCTSESKVKLVESVVRQENQILTLDKTLGLFK